MLRSLLVMMASLSQPTDGQTALAPLRDNVRLAYNCVVEIDGLDRNRQNFCHVTTMGPIDIVTMSEESDCKISFRRSSGRVEVKVESVLRSCINRTMEYRPVRYSKPCWENERVVVCLHRG